MRIAPKLLVLANKKPCVTLLTYPFFLLSQLTLVFAAGAITGDAAQGAKAGAAVGATGGAMRGIGARRAQRRFG